MGVCPSNSLWTWRRLTTVSPEASFGEYGVDASLLRTIQSLYSWSQSLKARKPDSFSALFLSFMDRISRGGYSKWFGGLRILSLLFADDMVLPASSNSDLALERVAAKCEGAGMNISAS